MASSLLSSPESLTVSSGLGSGSALSRLNPAAPPEPRVSPGGEESAAGSTTTTTMSSSVCGGGASTTGAASVGASTVGAATGDAAIVGVVEVWGAVLGADVVIVGAAEAGAAVAAVVGTAGAPAVVFAVEVRESPPSGGDSDTKEGERAPTRVGILSERETLEPPRRKPLSYALNAKDPSAIKKHAQDWKGAARYLR